MRSVRASEIAAQHAGTYPSTSAYSATNSQHQDILWLLADRERLLAALRSIRDGGHDASACRKASEALE